MALLMLKRTVLGGAPPRRQKTACPRHGAWKSATPRLPLDSAPFYRDSPAMPDAVYVRDVADALEADPALLERVRKQSM